MRTKWSHELDIISYVYNISDMAKTFMIHLLRHHFNGGMGHWWVEGFAPGPHGDEGVMYPHITSYEDQESSLYSSGFMFMLVLGPQLR